MTDHLHNRQNDANMAVIWTSTLLEIFLVLDDAGGVNVTKAADVKINAQSRLGGANNTVK